MEIYYLLVLWVGNPEFSVTGAGSCWGWSGFLRNPGLYRDSITLNSTWYSVCLNKRPPFIRPTPPGPRLTLITPPQLMISALILSEDTVWVTGGVRATAQDFWGIHYDNPMVINIQRWVTEEFCGYLCYVFSTRPCGSPFLFCFERLSSKDCTMSVPGFYWILSDTDDERP